MKQTAGKIFARNYFYNNFLASLVSPRQLRSCNVLTLLGEDFREIELLEGLGVPPYRVFSVEKDHDIYRRQQAYNRRNELGVALFYGGLSDYIHDHLHHHDISVFNLDICGSYLKAVDPVLGKMLLFVRRIPNTVMATYSSAGRDRPQLMEGLKSLVTLLWLSPDAVDRLVRQIYAQYRSAQLAESDRNRNEVAKNMLLRHMFWLRSHMEHIMIGAYELDVSSYESVSASLVEQEKTWQQFLSRCSFPLTYADVVRIVSELPQPQQSEHVRMDLDFGDVEFLTYAANDGFYHNCYFATFESSGSTVALDTWLVESSKSLRRGEIVLIDTNGNRYPSSYGQIAVNTDRAVLWMKDDVSADLRRIPLPPKTALTPVIAIRERTEVNLDASTVEQIRALARENPDMTAAQIATQLSLKMPMANVIAQVAVARRK